MVLLLGGFCEQQHHLKSTETVSVSWGKREGGGVAVVSEMGPQMLFKRSGACVVVLPAGGGESDGGGGGPVHGVYAIGGFGGTETLKTVEVLDVRCGVVGSGGMATASGGVGGGGGGKGQGGKAVGADRAEQNPGLLTLQMPANVYRR
jgi:hypothetical protein